MIIIILMIIITITITITIMIIIILRVGDKEQQKVKNIINKANIDRHMKDVQNQPWVEKFVTQH